METILQKKKYYGNIMVTQDKCRKEYYHDYRRNERT